jgi:hypothetical protein
LASRDQECRSWLCPRPARLPAVRVSAATDVRHRPVIGQDRRAVADLGNGHGVAGTDRRGPQPTPGRELHGPDRSIGKRNRARSAALHHGARLHGRGLDFHAPSN